MLKKGWKVYNTENILCHSWSKWDLVSAISGFGCGFCCCYWGFWRSFFGFVIFFWWCFLFDFWEGLLFFKPRHVLSYLHLNIRGTWAIWLLAVLYATERLLPLWNFITFQSISLCQNISLCLILFLGGHPAMLYNWVKSVRPEITGLYGENPPNLLSNKQTKNGWSIHFWLFDI